MADFLPVIGIGLLLSLQANIFLFYRLKKTAKEPQPTVDAQKLLSAIAGGSAVLHIQVIDPGDILLRSPRT